MYLDTMFCRFSHAISNKTNGNSRINRFELYFYLQSDKEK